CDEPPGPGTPVTAQSQLPGCGLDLLLFQDAGRTEASLRTWRGAGQFLLWGTGFSELTGREGVKVLMDLTEGGAWSSSELDLEDA
ncbi:hypothetical protein LEMLEM_LOCUS24516, partial [Lemmus lemmus]